MTIGTRQTPTSSFATGARKYRSSQAPTITLLRRQQPRQQSRSEERRVGKECRSRWSLYHYKKERHGRVRDDPRDREEGERRHDRALGPHHAVARRDGARRARDGALGHPPAAADRRRDDLARAHRGQDRAELLGAHGVGAGRIACGGCSDATLERRAARRIHEAGARRLREGALFFSSRRRHTRSLRDWSSDVCSSDLCSAGQVLKPCLTASVDANSELAGANSDTFTAIVCSMCRFPYASASNLFVKAVPSSTTDRKSVV